MTLAWRQMGSPATYEAEVRQSAVPQRAVYICHSTPESFWNDIRRRALSKEADHD